jgi:two-component system response regulator AtoC
MTDASLGCFSLTDDGVIGIPVETITRLASELPRPAVIIDCRCNVLYANRMACTAGPSDQAPAKCYEIFAQRMETCENCPIAKVFESGAILDGESLGSAACGLQQVYPLADRNGEVAAALACFERSSTRRVRVSDRVTTEDRRTGFGHLIGRSTVMRQLFDMIGLVADSSATVLIQGESGTGKELVARTIHQLSYRRDKPFVVVDCGSLPETLLESELFGHTKGAFTGATSNKLGLFEEADGGTIFLDEIADTTPTFQAKLLRALQEGEIKRVGGTHRIKIDVRVISATNKELTDLVQNKSFRQDLYYRLAVLPLQLPPLRDRRDDIPLLVRHFVAASCRRHHQPVRQVPDEVMATLSQGDWPGNVRELQHYIERTVVTTTGPEFSCHEIVRKESIVAHDLRSIVRDATRQAERARIVQALSQSSGNRAKAAKLLKISRASLYNKLRDYGVS